MVGKSQIIFLAFAEPPASLKFIFCRLPNRRQVSNYFFVVCRTLGKSQIIFLSFAGPSASPKIFFCHLPSFGQVSNLFFGVCSSGMVGAVPVCPPERPRSGVSIPKYICTSRIMHEDLTMDAPLQGDTGGHTGAAPTKLHHTFLHHSIKRHHPSTCNPPMINLQCTVGALFATIHIPITAHPSFNCRLLGGRPSRTTERCRSAFARSPG